MGKVFEDYFSELHVDMVDICMEYVDYQADKIYIYGSAEGRMIASDYFYQIDGQIVARHKTNTISPQYTVSTENQRECLSILNKDIEKIKKLCDEHNRPMPTEIKMIYDVKKNSLDVKYKYDNQWLNHKTKAPDDIAYEWFEEVKNEKNNLLKDRV